MSWEQSVSTVRSGPPLLLRPFDGPMNTVEFFIHVEDLRRAQDGWEPRAISPALAEALWAVGPGGMAKKVPATVVLSSPGRGNDKQSGTWAARHLCPEIRVSTPCSGPDANRRPGWRSPATPR